MTLQTASAKADVVKVSATQYKSDLMDMFARLSSHIMKFGKWDEEFNKLVSDISMKIIASTQDLETKSVDVVTELAKVIVK